MAILRFFRDYGRSYTQSHMAKSCGICPSSLNVALKLMERIGIIVKDKDGWVDGPKLEAYVRTWQAEAQARFIKIRTAK